MVGNVVNRKPFKLRDMECRMDRTEFAGKLEGKRLSGRLSNDFEWTEEAFRELLGGPSRFNVLRIYEHFGTYRKLGSW